ncbi:MAG: hypothetical protein Fur0039_22890 [Rhodocyclaceae bacterium]
MWILRIVGLLAVVAIGVSIVAFLLSRERRYLAIAWRIAKYALIFAFVVLLAFALERLAGMA